MPTALITYREAVEPSRFSGLPVMAVMMPKMSKERKNRYCGIMNTCGGTMMVKTTKAKSTERKRNLNRAKE